MLEELFANSTINVSQMVQHLKNTANSLGLPFGDRQHTYNSRLAQELGLWAESIGRGHDFHMAAFYAYFAKGKNLARKEVLVEIIENLGLPDREALKVIKERSFSTDVDADWQLSRKLEVNGVPTFILNHKKLVGAQPYNDLKSFVSTAGVKPH